MRIVAVTRVLNEDDIIEAFLRHHAPMVDHHIVLDNGSIDHTVSIVRRLHEEGLALSLFSNPAAVFQEMHQNTALYQLASQALQADWVVYLDCDEFIDLRGGGARDGTGLRDLLAGVPPNLPAIRLDMITYVPTASDGPAELAVPRRIGHRMPDLSGVWKVMVRGALRGEVAVLSGNHAATIDGQLVPAPARAAARLAHYPVRSIWQELCKITVGRLKVLAGGAETILQNFAEHYVEPFEMLMHRPGEALHGGRFVPVDAAAAGLVHDPIASATGALRYTNPTDYRLKATQSLLACAERIARHHGALLDITRKAGLGGDEYGVTRLI